MFKSIIVTHVQSHERGRDDIHERGRDDIHERGGDDIRLRRSQLALP